MTFDPATRPSSAGGSTGPVRRPRDSPWPKVRRTGQPVWYLHPVPAGL